MPFCLDRIKTIVSLLLLGIQIAGAQPVVPKEMNQLKKILTENHFQPRVIDDSYSREVFDKTLDQLDPERLYFTFEDIQSIKHFRDALDDEWNNGKVDYLIALTPLFKRVLMRAQKLLSSSASSKIDWQTSDTLEIGPDLKPVRNEAELRKRWVQWIKFRLLTQIKERVDQDSLVTNPGMPYLIRHESDERKKLVRVEGRALHVILDAESGPFNKAQTAYFKAITAAFDPHSIYLPPVEVENFIGALSSQEYSFGLVLKERDNGDIEIERLVPGGAAWKSGRLHQNDILVALRSEDKKVVSLAGIGLEELSSLLEVSNHLAIELTVKKSDGVRQSVHLQKEKTEDESSIVKGFVLHGRNTVGYISLPQFYSNWGSEGGSRCANDMAREILKLKKENIEGLILDIRSNGGGSVTEAIELAGIFINEGPLAVFKNKAGVLTTLKDVNRGTIYDGPLVLLIDGRSASAAELLAAALQDYHRAIIAGSASFGKATGQRIFSLDPASQKPMVDPSRKPDAGFVTVTIENIYRITGKSVQGNGIEPDIHLPDLYEPLSPHERELPNAMLLDSVVARVPFQACAALPITSLQRKSKERVAHNHWFTFVEQLNLEAVSAVKNEKKSILLSEQKFLDPEPRNVADRAIFSPDSPFSSVTLPEADRSPRRDQFATENNKTWIKRLAQDEYVIEAFFVIADYLGIKK